MSSTLAEIRTASRSPLEVALCAVRWLPDNLFAHLRADQKILPHSVLEWKAERSQFYAAVGDWLASWRLGMREPTGELAALAAPAATSLHHFIDCCYFFWKVTPSAQGRFSSYLSMACNALMSDFLSQMADSGVGHLMGLPGYPPALVEGKSEHYRRSVTSLRALGQTAGNHATVQRGRPKGFAKQTYPAECLEFDTMARSMANLAKRDRQFRDGVYTKWLQSMSAETTFCESSDAFQIGIAGIEGLTISGKGVQLGRVVEKTSKRPTKPSKRGRPRKTN